MNWSARILFAAASKADNLELPRWKLCNDCFFQHCHCPHIPRCHTPLHCQTQVCDENLGGKNSSQSIQPQPCSVPSCLRWQKVQVLELICFRVHFHIFSGIGTVICLPASVWLLNKEGGSYEEKTFQIKIPTNAFELGPKNTFPLLASWNATALKNIPTLDISTESNFWNGLL